jgi:AraC family transcriptional regulator of adaptative response/methylated-DNA-[protein]-cysteine methyltransferase
MAHAADPTARRIVEACRRIELADGAITSAALAEGLGIGPAQLRRDFRARLGVSPRAYAESLRLMRLAATAGAGRAVARRVLDAGFGSIGRGYASAGRSLGLPPGRLGASTEIGWWIGLSDLGWMLIAATGRGICRIAFGDDPDRLRAELEATFPRARLWPDEARLRGWLDQVRERVLLPGAALDLPLDVQGTAFQARVWAALRAIPLGATASYMAVAGSLGMPKSARAVAAACAANPVAVLIPCHRVVASDGRLAGYRWGLERKRTLLARERAAASPAVCDARAPSARHGSDAPGPGTS